MLIFELIPLFIAVILYKLLSTKRGYWSTKLEVYLEEYKDVLKPEDISNLKNLVEDISLSITFINSYVSIIIGMLLSIIIGLLKGNHSSFNSDIVLFLTTMIVYIVITKNLLKMKTKYMDDRFKIKINTYIFKPKYVIVFDISLIIGYLFWAYIIIC
jgi:predicted phosphohydrolase